MSRKDYVSLAKELNALLGSREFKYYSTKHMFDAMVTIIADAMEKNNGCFDRDKFRQAVYAVEE